MVMADVNIINANNAEYNTIIKMNHHIACILPHQLLIHQRQYPSPMTPYSQITIISPITSHLPMTTHSHTSQTQPMGRQSPTVSYKKQEGMFDSLILKSIHEYSMTSMASMTQMVYMTQSSTMTLHSKITHLSPTTPTSLTQPMLPHPSRSNKKRDGMFHSLILKYHP